MRNHNVRGFTLIEILLAIAIFSILSMAAYQILQGVLRSGEISKEHDQRLTELQRGMLLIERDFMQMVARQSRSAGIQNENLKVLYVGEKVLESESQGIEFSRLGWTNPLNLFPRSNILRVGYRVKEDELQRLYYLYPDVASGQEPEVQTIMTGIESITFRVWSDGWLTSWNNKDQIPEGIEVTIKSKYYGEVRRVFQLPYSEVAD